MLDPDSIVVKIVRDEDYVNLKRFGYSLKELMKRYPDGCPNNIIASALMMTESELENVWQGIVHQLREQIHIKERTNDQEGSV